MNQSLTEKFIFISRNEDEVSKVFSRKIVEFHESFSDSLMLSSLGGENQSLESMDMDKNPDFDDSYFRNTIIGLGSVEPLMVSTLINDEKIEAYLSIFYLPFFEVEGFFLLQQIANWGGSNKTSYQVWALNDDSNLYDMMDTWDFIV
jgi:hypothetical protein